MEKAKKDKTEYAIEVTDLDKSFWIPDEKVTSLKSYFLNPLNLFRQKGKRFDALSDVSFKIKKGEFVGVIGRNGSGKSTLLKTLAGIYAPDKGEIKINGKLVPFLELGVGFNPDLSARENVYLNGAILGMSRKYLQEKFDEIIDFAEIREFVDTPVKNFSSGMMVRLAFAIAIQSDADIFLLDEVFGVGDANFRLKSYQKFLEFKKQNKTIILVSHSMNDILEHSNKVLHLEKGHLEKFDTAQKVVNSYEQDNIDYAKKTLTKKSEFEVIGGNDLKISRVELTDKKGNRSENFQTGDDIYLRVSLVAEKGFENVFVGIALYKNMEDIVYGTNNKKRGAPIEELSKGKTDIIFKFENNAFLKGDYQIVVALGTSATGEIQKIDKEIGFHIEQKDTDDYGVWQISPTVNITHK